jgi:hypothetical protein
MVQWGTRDAAGAGDAWWVGPVQGAALVVLAGLALACLFLPHVAGRAFWTVAIAALPLFFVLAGYHRWRRICPLAFVAQVPARLGMAGHRRAGPWLQAHAYHVAFAVFLASLWLRLVATNGDGRALAVFLVTLCAVALLTGFLFTGKTWCNYLCPVSFVEKLYTEPRGLRDTPNSQCGTCTACRPACPDINEENSYWKEILQPAKRDVYFAFPGVVLAFYGYYFLQAGDWSYYFDGRWTNEPGLFRTAFLPGLDAITAGFFFLPQVPRAAAAALTLVAGGALSLAAFRWLEPVAGRVLARRGAADDDAAGTRSVLFTLAAFTAFVSFYSFAGAPTLRLVPGLPHAFQVLVVCIATLCLVRRLGRRQAAFAEETLARRIVANWRWADAPPPRDLREAFLVHTIRAQSQADARRQMLDLYKSAIRDSLDAGMLSRRDVHRLDALRRQLRIADADHELAMSELADEGGGLAASQARHASPEKQLQLETYAEALALHLERDRRAAPSAYDALVHDLQERYGVTPEEHAAVVARLLQTGGLAAHLTGVPAAIEWLAAAIAAFETKPSPAMHFLVRLLRRRWTRAAHSLVRTLAGEGPVIDALSEALRSPDPRARDEVLGVLGSLVSPGTVALLAASVERARAEVVAADAAQLLRAQLASPEPYLRAMAMFLLERMDQATEADFDGLEADEHPIVRETAAASRATAGGAVPGAASTIEKMIGLRSIGIFDELDPEDLAQLARAGTEAWFTEGECLCREGATGDEVFVLLDGEVSVSQNGTLRTEGPGTCVGELAVLDPAPYEATVVASTVAIRTLRLTGASFRQALGASPVVSEAIIRILARRLRLSGAPARTSAG